MTDQFVTVACSKCNAEYQISVTYAGMPGECGVCGEVFVFPSKEDINAAFGYDVCGQVAAAQAAEAAAANGAAQPAAEQAVAEQPAAEQPPVPEAEPVQSVPQEEDQEAPSFQGTAPAEDEVFTSTIKMSRSKIAGGMIPKLNDDEFQFSLSKKTVTETSAVTEQDIQEIKAILNNDGPAASGPKRKWWQYLFFWIKPKE